MTSVTSQLAKQYGDSRKLAARAGINSKDAIADVGWFPWMRGNCRFKREIGSSTSAAVRVGSGKQW